MKFTTTLFAVVVVVVVLASHAKTTNHSKTQDNTFTVPTFQAATIKITASQFLVFQQKLWQRGRN